MATLVTLNGTSIQTANIVISQIGDDSSPAQVLNLETIARRDGEKLLSAQYKPKSISLSGIIKGSSIADLEARLDQFKRLCDVTDGRLDIEYAGEVRRFVVGLESFSVNRQHYHVTFAPFSIIFTVYDPPYGQNVSALGGSLAAKEALSLTAQTGQAAASAVSFDGSAPPKPIITYTIDNDMNLNEIIEQVIGKKNIISVGTYFTAGDRLVIDTDNQVVLLNGRKINFEGTFPEYEIGDNTMVTTFSEGSSIIDQQQVSIDDFVTLKDADNIVFQGFQVSTTTTYFQVDLYLRRDTNCRSGTLTLTIRNSSGNNPGPTTITNASITINATDIPVDSGWVRFKFATNPSLSVSTDYRLVLQNSGLTGSVYAGIARSNNYANGLYGFSLNNAATWRSDSNAELAFRIWKTTASLQWSVDKKVDYIKRWL